MRNWFEHWAPRLGGGALVLCLTLVLVSAGAIATGLHQLREVRSRVLARDDNIRLLQVLQRDVRMAETGQRGYLLVNNPVYLGPYRDALRRIPDDLAGLGQAGLVDRSELLRLQALVRDKLQELALTIDLHDRSPDAALGVVRSDRGQRYMDMIDVEIARLVDGERSRLRADTVALNRTANLTALAVGAASLLALFAGALGVVLILRQRRIDALRALNATLERRVEERTQSLTEANQELDAFAYTISHDLRAPLRAIHGYADVITEDAGAALPDELRSYLGRITRAAEQMNRLIEDILAYAKLSKESLTVRPVGLDGLVRRARQHLERECAGAEIAVHGPLGDVLAHPTALQQAVENLLSNACKYVTTGTAPVIHIRAEVGEGWRRLWVVDAGIGVSPEHYDRIFKPFERLHGVESYPGTGIGLAIVRRSIERMGGRCGVEPAHGGGSAFWIELRQAGEAV